jgi:predicted DNA-binding transcriptional regulator AlpA
LDTPQIKLLRFADLKEAQVVTSWPQLKRLVQSHEFPPGFMLSPCVRVWDAQDVERWLQRRRDAAAGRESGLDQAAA